MMHTSAKAALGTCTNLAAECKVLPEDSEYIESVYIIALAAKYVRISSGREEKKPAFFRGKFLIGWIPLLFAPQV